MGVARWDYGCLNGGCYDGSGASTLMDVKCLLPAGKRHFASIGSGQWCVGDAGTVASLHPTGKSVCKCKLLFEENRTTNTARSLHTQYVQQPVRALILA
ncbi:hypothetical protein BV898_01470 [Hypsibius exemplaris]|uniref:Uncharacterized protein n=1 Tax=Hypsibius exemplaris TaxID=2072580 RepID=A0A1W0XBK3_HYPEX|nr:hypothetical protein BV898_01470 [Hypsibius exemplaris]